MIDRETLVIDAESRVREVVYKELLDDGKTVSEVVSQTHYRPELGVMWHFVLPRKREKLSKRMLSFTE